MPVSLTLDHFRAKGSATMIEQVSTTSQGWRGKINLEENKSFEAGSGYDFITTNKRVRARETNIVERCDATAHQYTTES